MSHCSVLPEKAAHQGPSPPSNHLGSVQANLVVQENRHILAMQDLQKAQAELDAKQAELDVVQAEYEQAMTEKQVSSLWPGGAPWAVICAYFSICAQV